MAVEIEWTLGNVLQLAIAGATALAAVAAWRSTVLQKNAQEQTAEHVAEGRRYRELADVFGRAIEVNGAMYSALVAYVHTGFGDRSELVALFGRGAAVAGLVRLRYDVDDIPEPVGAALSEFAETLEKITDRLPPWWCPRRLYWRLCSSKPDDLLEDLRDAHFALADAARDELDKLSDVDLPV